MNLFVNLLILVLASLIITKSSKAESNKYFLCQNSVGSICELKNVYIYKGDTYKISNGKESNTILTVKFIDSQVQELSDSLCNALPNLQFLRLNDVFLKSVEENAFEKCKIIREIHFQDNELTEIPKNTFNQNTMIRQIILSNNKLESIDIDLFRNLSRLTYLDLCVNKLYELPPEIFLDTHELTFLDLRNNRLLELNIEEIVHYLPKLENILFRDLNLECKRFKAIRDFSIAHGLNIYFKEDWQKLHSKTPDEFLRQRLYPPNFVEGIKQSECLNKEQHEREIELRKLFEKNRADGIKSLKSDYEISDDYDENPEHEKHIYLKKNSKIS